MKRCPRCQAAYTDEVRWCPADGTPTEAVASAPPPATNQIPEGAPTLHDMPAVGPVTAGWDIPPEPSPLPGPISTTLIGGPSPLPAPRGPALSPELAKLAASIPPGPPSSATLIGTSSLVGPHGPATIQGTAPEVRAPAPPSTVPGALIPPISAPLANTFMGTTAEPPRTPHGSPAELAPNPQGNTFTGTAPVLRAPAPPSTPPSTVPGALIPPIGAPLHNTFMGTTAEPPRTPHGSPVTPAELAARLPIAPASHAPGPVSMGWNIPDAPADLPVAPAAHTPGPVSLGWNIPDLPPGSSLTGAPAVSPAALAAAATPEPANRPGSSTLPGFAPSPEVLRAIQEQRAKLAAQPAQPQPMAAPEIAPEAYIPSGTATPAESYASMAVSRSTAMTAVGSAPDPALNSTLPALSPLPMQPSVVVMASQPSAISQAPLPSTSMPHAIPPVVVSPSLAMAAAEPPASPPKPPTASLLEAPAFQAKATAAAAARPATSTDQHRAVRGNKTLWIVFAVIAVAMAGGTVALVVTR